MTLPMPDVEITVSEAEATRLLDGDSEIVVDVEDKGDPYTIFLVKVGNRAEAFHIVSVTATTLKEIVREFRSAGYDSEMAFRKVILESHPKVMDHSTLYCHRVAVCKCSNCRRYCDDYNPESVCASWNGRLGR